MLQLTAQNFDSEIHGSSLVIVMFYANWCSKCAIMKPVYESLEKKYRSQIKFCSLDIERFPVLAQTYETEIVPMFVFFKSGQIEAAFAGILDETVFNNRLQKIFRNC